MDSTCVSKVLDAIPLKNLGVDDSMNNFFDGVGDPSVWRFVINYSDASFGWKAARILAERRLELPPVLRGEDHWLFKAYLYCLDTEKYYNKHISEARSFLAPQMRTTKELIEALLICQDADIAKIGKYLSIDKRTIMAYEKLFFNVLDRKADGAYIQKLVYPSHRIVEHFDRYTTSEDFSKLILRIGFNGTMLDVLKSSGVPGEYFGEVPLQDMAKRLEASIMAQGQLIAKYGWLNQRSSSTAMRYATGLMAAAKQGGDQSAATSTSDFDSLGKVLMDEFNKMYSTNLEFTSKPEFKRAKTLVVDSASVS